jgi:hypothetical protein
VGDDPVHLAERGRRRGEVLEHLRAVDAIPCAIPERQMLGVALHQRAALRQTARRLRQQRLGEVDPEAMRTGGLYEEVPGAASDFQDSIAGPWGEQGEDATDALALDIPD